MICSRENEGETSVLNQYLKTDMCLGQVLERQTGGPLPQETFILVGETETAPYKHACNTRVSVLKEPSSKRDVTNYKN